MQIINLYIFLELSQELLKVGIKIQVTKLRELYLRMPLNPNYFNRNIPLQSAQESQAICFEGNQ
jgi:hypothetical protein